MVTTGCYGATRVEWRPDVESTRDEVRIEESEHLFVQLRNGDALELQGPIHAERRGSVARFSADGHVHYVQLREVEHVDVEAFSPSLTVAWIGVGLLVAVIAVAVFGLVAAANLDLGSDERWADEGW